MNHPIYNELSPYEVEMSILLSEGNVKEADRIGSIAVNKLAILGESKGVAESEDYMRSILVLKTSMAAKIIEDGYVKIDASHDDWYNPISQKTISAMKIENFKCPFPSGTITIGSNVYMFSYDSTGMVFVLISQPEEIKEAIQENGFYKVDIEGEANKSLVMLALRAKAGKNIGEQISDEGMSEEQVKEAFSILSALMYIAMSNSSVKEYKDALHKKVVKTKGKKKKGIPEHSINVINVRQKIKKGNGYAYGSRKSDKTWIVRGHWRNQWYSKLNDHKSKWIDPYFKGDGKVAADKVYKI